MQIIGKRRGLGRGLGALIPGAHMAGAEDQATPTPPTSSIPLAAIQPNPFQPRRHFPEASIAELTESIREKGILQPLLVRQVANGYELIAGERRFRAAQRAGLQEVPVTVREATDSELLEMALIENIQRENLNPIEEAEAYQRLVEEFGLTQEDVASRVGKDRSTIANTIRLLGLPSDLKAEIQRGNLSAGHARALVSIASEQQKIDLARQIVASKLTVRATERLVRDTLAKSSDIEQQAVEQRLTEALGTKVRIVTRKDGHGRIEIDYFSLDQLNGLIDRLSAAEGRANF
jgi:ParB family transcriptional regulator, chromosome partitioning protein